MNINLNLIIGFIGIPLGLLLSGWLITTCRFWSSLANHTVPWLCSAIALSVLIQGVTCLATQTAPKELPGKCVMVVCVSVLIVLGAELFVDHIAYRIMTDTLAAFGEWIGFGVILVGVFLLPRIAVPKRRA